MISRASPENKALAANNRAASPRDPFAIFLMPLVALMMAFCTLSFTSTPAAADSYEAGYAKGKAIGTTGTLARAASLTPIVLNCSGSNVLLRVV